ncbi:hypothetical protein WJX74_000236 [Apatococcus lobatus]|uniref:Uncharacterized protein n=1 Tax=Apatococcus lobatus TaxID=904363 RepID=A0AAW1QMR1_9CHLO
MAEKDTTRRPKRRCARKQSVVPSAVHYVGYVEEDETPEMIMKKFEELERVMATSTAERPSEAGPSSASGDLLNLDSSEPGLEELAADQEAEERTLTEAQLMEVFKQTSIFNVKTALAGNEVLVGSEANQLDDVDQHALDDAELSDEEDSWEYMRGFWSDEDDGDYAEHWRQATKLGKASRRGARRSSGLPSAASRLATLTHYNAATRSLIRRRVHVVDKDALYRVMIPIPPVPISWARTVKPYVPLAAKPSNPAANPPASNENHDLNGMSKGLGAASQEEAAAASYYHECSDVAHMNFKACSRSIFQGLFINAGWAHPSAGAAQQEPLQRLARLPIPQLCPIGFVFIFADKEHIAGVVKQMHRWKFIYIENLTWVFLHANNSILQLPSPYARRSHITMLMFRREGLAGKRIELRHQRNPDVAFDCVASSPGQPHATPNEVFIAIETLLPTGKGEFLELWAANGTSRPGWTHVAEISSK